MLRRPLRPRTRSSWLHLGRLAVALASWLIASPTLATPVVLYTFEDEEGDAVNAPSTVEDGLSAGAWLSDLSSISFVAGSPGLALSTNQWGVDAATGNALRFLLAPETEQTLALTGFGFDQMRSGTGPTSWSLLVAGSPVAGGDTSTSFQGREGALASLLVSAPTEIALIATGASSSAGTWRIDNFRLEGHWVAAVPEPSVAALLASGFALAAARQRPQRRRDRAA